MPRLDGSPGMCCEFEKINPLKWLFEFSGYMYQDLQADPYARPARRLILPDRVKSLQN